MKKKHLVLTAAALSLAMALGACGSYAGAATSLTTRSATETGAEHREGTVESTVDTTVIGASDSVITVTGDRAVAAGGTVVIQKAGTYVLRGNFAEGQLVANAEEGAEIKLVLDGFAINGSTNAPLVLESGASITTVLQDGTESAVSDLRSGSEDSKAAVYAKSDLTISGRGTLAVQGDAENAIHSEVNVTMESDMFILKTGDDDTHADETLTVRNGNINITESEGRLEGLVVNIQGGVITVTTKGDGINASDRVGSDAAPGQATEDAAVRTSGGVVTVEAGGDGIDSNGNLAVSGGTVVVDGPSDGGNAPLGYGGKGVITGNAVFMMGDNGMFQTLNDSGSTQKGLAVSLNSTQGAGTKVKIANLKGDMVYEDTTTTQTLNTLLFNAADPKQGGNYTMTAGSKSRTMTVSNSANINSENGGNRGAPSSRPEGCPDGQHPEDGSKNGDRRDNRRDDRGERNDRPGDRGRRSGNALKEDRDGEVRNNRGVGQRSDGQHPEGRPESNGQQGDRNQNGKRPEDRSENGVRQGGRGQNDNRPEGRSENGVRQGGRSQNDDRPEDRPENGVRQDGRDQNGNRLESGLENGGQQGGRSQNKERPEGKPESDDRQGNRGQDGKHPGGRPESKNQQDNRGQNDKRPEGGSENGSQQGNRDWDGKRPGDKPKNGSRQGGRRQNGKHPEGRPESGGQQDGRGQDGRRPEDRPKNDGRQGKQCGKRSVNDNDKNKGTCSCSTNCSCWME